MSLIFDTHAHYDDPAFDADRDALLAAMPEQGVGLILDPGCDLASSRAAVALAERFPHVYAAVGWHPENCAPFVPEDIDALRELAKHPKVVAIGEIGLDYHWDTNPPKEQQQAIFRAQLALAVELDKPVIVHDRDAHADCLALVSEQPRLRGVFHCFSGSPELAEILLKRGWYLGFDGPITYKNAKKALAVLDITPLDRILLETDAPYLPPVPHRGERNDSRFLPYIAAAAAARKGLEPEELARIAAENGRRLFGLPETREG
jgi:TatD DNase family protein